MRPEKGDIYAWYRSLLKRFKQSMQMQAFMRLSSGTRFKSSRGNVS